MWNGRRYHSLDFYLKQEFGEKLYKLSLDGGMTCPNRDGTLSYGGCIFCSGDGSGDFAAKKVSDLSDQINTAKSLIYEKYKGERFIAYFQSYTNTYAPVSYLRNIYMPVINRKDIEVLDIATRPDCLSEDILLLIKELSSIKPVWVELGLQTADDKTAALINRCYKTAVYDKAVDDLHKYGAQVITHMIIGLPHENRETILSTAKHIANCGSDGIKLQLLHILEGTRLAQMYRDGVFNALKEDKYISLLCDIIAILPPQTVIHRLTGDGDKNKLIAPEWSKNKRRVLNHINHELKKRDIIQGCKYFSYS